MKNWFLGLVATCCLLATNVMADEHYVAQHYTIEDGLSQNTVMTILQDKAGYMWFGTWDGLNCFDGYTFKVFKGMENGKETMVNNRVQLLYEDNEEVIWWQTYDNHFYRLNSHRTEVRPATYDELPTGMLEKIADQDKKTQVDKNGVIWQVDDKPGILRYRYGQWKRFTPKLDERYAGQLRENFFLLEDKLGRTWVNPTGGGWSYYDSEKDELVNPFHNLTNMIHTAYVDRDGQMWIATYDHGVDCVNMDPQPYELYDLRSDKCPQGEVRAFLQRKNGKLETFVKDQRKIYCAVETRYGVLYGTKGFGVKTESGKIVPTSHPDVYDIVEGGDGTLYIGTYGGGVNIVAPQNNGFAAPKVIGNGLKVRVMTIVDNVLWCGTTTGLLRLDLETLDNELIPFYDIRDLCYSKDKVWLATFGGGLNTLDPKADTLKIERVKTTEDIVQSLSTDGSNLWFTSEHQVTQYNIETGDFYYYNAMDGQKDAYFTEAMALRTQTGKVLFGYSNGYCLFDPARVNHSQTVPKMQLVSCTSNGEVICHHEGHVVLENGADFTVSYSALDFMSPKTIQYRYKMDGIDNNWNYVGSQRRVSYSNLTHGKYVFHVASTNREGMEAENEITLEVTVKKPLYLTWWAFCLYVLTIALLVVITCLILAKNERMRQQIKVEQKVTDLKLQFFTNISHELRTPLTLIIAPVENILHNEHLTASVKSQLEIVESNAQRMLRMVNQLLDFRKVQNQKMRLKVEKADLQKLAEDTCANFRKEAYDKHIRFTQVNKAKDSTIWVDKQRFDSILYNLLSNAFKFTASGKKIEVRILEKPGYLLLQVEDEGCGIPMDKRNLLFERFSNHNELNKNTDVSGTGIGLSFVKELVDLHHGYIEVESKVGKGSTFTVFFRTGKDHFGRDVDIIEGDHYTETQAQNEAFDFRISTDSQQNKRKIMVVDDNEDMRTFLRSILQNDYIVTMAGDGQEAMKQLGLEMPDLIITDLMMPNMDGLELTNLVKRSQDLNHIPVVLLTAKTAIESRLQAMQYGADDYVTKPFEPEYLRARIKNILSQREQLEQSYRKRLMRLEPQKIDEKQPGDAFLAKLLNIMSKQMDNNTLTVDELVEDMGMGRTVFFNKLKSLTGLSPVEFIREMRIKRAAQLLEQQDYNITEVTYMVGMNDSRYFAKCFKQTYGVTPSEYRKSRGLDKKE